MPIGADHDQVGRSVACVLGEYLFDRAAGTRKLVDCNFDAVSCEISGDISAGSSAVLGLWIDEHQVYPLGVLHHVQRFAGGPCGLDGRVPRKEDVLRLQGN